MWQSLPYNKTCSLDAWIKCERKPNCVTKSNLPMLERSTKLFLPKMNLDSKLLIRDSMKMALANFKPLEVVDTSIQLNHMAMMKIKMLLSPKARHQDLQKLEDPLHPMFLLSKIAHSKA